jgi:hypothetical protein
MSLGELASHIGIILELFHMSREGGLTPEGVMSGKNLPTPTATIGSLSRVAPLDPPGRRIRLGRIVRVPRFAGVSG